MTTNTPINLWDSPEHARDYLGRADSILHRSEGESTLLEFLPLAPRRILDLGTGDGRLLALVRTELSEREAAGDRHGKVEAVAVDFSPAMPKPPASALREIPRSLLSLTTSTTLCPRWEASTRSYPALRFIICCTNGSARFMPRFIPC